MMAPRILALDLSLVATGWCLGGESGVFKPKTRGWQRVCEIDDKVNGLAMGTDLVAIEGYSFGSKGRSVFQIAELGGVIRYSFWNDNMPLVEVSPSTLKKFATGRGNCGKDQMIAAAIRRFGFEGSDNNEADAFLLWCMAMHYYGEPVAPIPQTHAAALKVVTWPELVVV